MILAFDSLQRKTIQEVLGREKARVLTEMLENTVPEDSRFVGMSREEIDDFFSLHRNELDFVAMLDIMSAAEAAIRSDYRKRLDKRLKDSVSKSFKKINKRLSKNKRSDKVSLEEDILDTWATELLVAKGPVSDFKGALKLRDWLAHGRYWDPRMGRRQYSPHDVYDISNNLLQAIDA